MYKHMPIIPIFQMGSYMCSQINDFFYTNGQITSLYVSYTLHNPLGSDTGSDFFTGDLSENYKCFASRLCYMCIVCCLYIACCQCYLHVRHQ